MIRTRLPVLFAVALLSAPALHAADDDGPVVRLFPTTVLEDIRRTSTVAAEMEDSLSEVIDRMAMQQELYTESLCEGADEDPGCQRLGRQLGATYLEMLELMEARLPEMERSVASTREALERRLREEIGRRSTPSTLQDTLLGEVDRGRAVDRPALRGRSGVRLSDRFRQYYALVASENGGGQSLSVIAADIYLDMADAEGLIVATRQEIARASLMEQLNQSFGVITPRMGEVVAGVRGVLFGEGAGSAIAAAPDVPADDTFVSPLAF